MNNQEIHTGLSNKDIRDYIALSLVAYNFMENTAHKEKKEKELTLLVSSKNYSRIDYAIKCAELEIEFNQNKLKNLKAQGALHTIMDTFRWQEFDVSDETQRQNPNEMWWSFIGTQEEYDNLITTLKNEQ